MGVAFGLQSMAEKPRFRLRDLTPYEQRRYGDRYVKFERYPPRLVPKDGVAGKFWTQDELDQLQAVAPQWTDLFLR